MSEVSQLLADLRRSAVDAAELKDEVTKAISAEAARRGYQVESVGGAIRLKGVSPMAENELVTSVLKALRDKR